MRIDMHVHTSNSKDSNLTLEKIAEIGKRKKLGGVAITDHNIITLKKIKKIKGFSFIPGVEIKTEFGEILVYNLKNIPKFKDFFDLIDKIKKDKKCILVIPHAFDLIRREAIKNENVLEKIKDKIDYMEINGRSFPRFRAKAIEFAKKNNIKLIAGSDAHWGFEIGNCYSEMDKNFRVQSIKINSFFPLIPLLLTKIRKVLLRHR
jgi:predicted metal-dependent phosphoesterase TrpH